MINALCPPTADLLIGPDGSRPWSESRSESAL